MEKACRVNSFEATQQLIDEILAVGVRQLVRLYHLVQIARHQLLDQVHLGEAVVGKRFRYIEKGYNVLMVKVAQQFELS